LGCHPGVDLNQRQDDIPIFRYICTEIHTMKTCSTYTRFILILLALGITWVYLASLVNFHQHRIRGKHLVPELVFIIKQKEKNKAAFAKKAGCHEFSGKKYHSPPLAIHQDDMICHLQDDLILISAEPYSTTFSQHCPGQLLLRGPPHC